MATASDEGERTCPLCTEEMDLTDQQLKPCKCGYEICVWCWHHIMDMAEKDDTEGRCPACRTPYDKEKIVGMAANCERMVAEINSERRLKLQKAKSKTSEGRKHLSSVRVIQRNLVYIIGLPANLADEAILERKEYFGQYGKVLKVSITWPASGSQQSNTNTCSVYITYTKEEEAVRCIQSVHGFVLEGRSLRACFGTTKYCHTWLRNMPCNNPDCLYLHDMGSPEDSFTKDEIISAYTRVQQISGVANNSQRRSGNMLPPPADEFCNNSNPASGKLVIKSTSNNPSNQVMASPNCSSSGRSSVLPAAASWGLRVSSSSRPPAASMACLQGPANQKTDTLNGSFDLPLKTACAAVTSDLRGNAKKIPTTKESDPMHLNDRSGLEAAKYIGSQTTAHAAAKVFLDSDYATMANQLSTSSEDKDRGITKPPNFTCTEDLDRQQSCGSGCSEVAHGCVVDDETILTISSRLSAIDVDNQLAIEHPDIIKHLNLISDNFSTRLDGNPVGVQQHYLEYGNDTIEPLTSPLFRKAVMVSEGSCLSGELPNWSSELRTRVLSAAGREMDDTQMPDDDQRLKLSEAATYPSYLAYSCNPLKAPHLSTGYHSQDTGNTGILANADPRAVDKGIDTLLSVGGSVLSNRYDKNKFSSYELGYRVDRSDDISNVDSVQCLERYSGDASEIDRNASIDLGESTIISNILSWDLDAGDDSLTSPRSLAKLLGETDKQNSSLKLSSPWRLQNSSQSRFSFARQEDFVANRATQLEHSFSNNSGDAQKNYINLQDSIENSNTSRDKFRNGFTVNSLEVSESLTNGLVPPNKVAVSRPQISAPPGFSVPSRSPPPGFTSQERVERAFVPACSGNQLLESLLLRKQYQAPSTGNNGGSFADVELIDPAILAVGKGTLPLATSNSGIDLPSTFSAQLNVSEHDSRLPLMMQQSFSTHPNFRFSDHMPDQFSPLNDSYTSSRFVEQTHGKAHMSLPQSRNSRISNNQWDGWNEVQTGNDLVLSEIVRNERLGLTKYFPGHEELKFHMSSSGNLYNRAFGM